MISESTMTETTASSMTPVKIINLNFIIALFCYDILMTLYIAISGSPFTYTLPCIFIWLVKITDF